MFLERFICKILIGLGVKILIISTEALETPPQFGYGGIEWITFWLAKGLHDIGHTVGLVGIEGSRAPYNDVKLYEILSKGEKYAGGLMGLRIGKILDDFKPDVVSDHSHMKTCFTEVQKRNIPYIPSSHTISIPDLGVPKPCWTALSKSHARWLNQRYGVECKVCYNGIDHPEKPITKWKAKNLPPIVLGRPNPEKGILDVVDFCKRHDIGLNVIAGMLDIEQVGYAFLIAQECKIFSKWTYHGQVSHEKKMQMLSQSKCLINFPSWQEPFGLIVPEANWVGTPAISLDMGAFSELIEDGKTGFIIPVQRDESGAPLITMNIWGFPRAVFDEQKVLDSLHNVEILDLEYVASYVRKKFNIYTMAEQYLKVYEDYIDRGERW
jgi:glycosyltransferase involved in cell wall biosynthesis